MEKKTINDVDFKGKLVFVRCDFNVPLNDDGTIRDDTRIEAALPTIRLLKEKGARVILASHFGRPKGEVNPKYSMKPVAESLSQKLSANVKLSGDVIGEDAQAMASSLGDGDVGLLENLRFNPGEEANDPEFSKALASLGGGVEIYVNDAFGTAHRAHSSTEGITHYVEGDKVAGLLMEKEINALGAVLEKPEKPFVAILGGAKVSDKIGVIENLLDKVDTILIGGAMANTFLKAKGYDIGSSMYEEDKLQLAKDIMKEATEQGVEIVLPKDARIAKLAKGEELTKENIDNAEQKQVKLYTEKEIAEGKGESLEGYQILDIGNNTQMQFADSIENAETIAWNGPLGFTEVPPFDLGTARVANVIAGTKAKCVIGGGDSVSAVKKIIKEEVNKGKDKKDFDNIYLSTGGGASLEFLEGKTLPGIAALDEKTPIQSKGEGTPKDYVNQKTI